VSVNQRIKKILEGKKLNKEYIEEHIGIGKDTLSNYQDTKYNLPKPFNFMKWLFKEYPNLNPHWLFFGEEPQFIDFNKIKQEDLQDRVKKLEEARAAEPTLEKINELINQLEKSVTNLSKRIDEIEDFKK